MNRWNVAWIAVLFAGAWLVSNIKDNHIEDCRRGCGSAGMKSYRVESKGWYSDVPICECNPPATTTDGGSR